MNLAFEIAVNFYQGFLIIYFCKHFFRSKESSLTEIICAFSAGAFLCLHEYYSLPIPDTIVFLSGFVYMCFTKRGTWYGRLLCCALLAALWIACVTTVNEVFSSLYGEDAGSLLQYDQDNRILYLLTSNVFITIWIFVASRIVRRNLHVKVPYVSAFLFLALLISEWLSSELVFVASVNAENKVASSVPLCFLMLFTLSMTLLIYDYYCKTLERAVEAENEARMLIDSQKHQGDLNRLYDALMRTQHDMKHRIAIAETMLMNGNKKSNETIQEALTEGLDSVEVFYTGNETIDAILTAKCATAKANEIIFDFQPYSLQKHPLNDITFGILIGNLLDNAIEAVKRISDGSQERFVELGFSQKMEMFCISCVNTTVEEHVEITSNLIFHRRENGHGYGLDSIKHTVEANGGKCTITSKEHMFCVNILIPFGDKNNNG